MCGSYHTICKDIVVMLRWHCSGHIMVNMHWFIYLFAYFVCFGFAENTCSAFRLFADYIRSALFHAGWKKSGMKTAATKYTPSSKER